MITYAEAKKILSKYQGVSGKCPGDADTELFIKQVLQYLLNSGAYGNERTFVMQAQNGCITLPRELETPLKLKIDGEVGSVWNRWFEYMNHTQIEDCCLATEALLTQPNRYPTVYDVPACGSNVAVIADCCEDEDAHVVVKGKDPAGKTIYTWHKGEQIVGEYLTARKGVLTRSTSVFSQITEVAKTKTNGYVNLVSIDSCGLNRSFLSAYDPFETAPSYQRARIISRPCPPICAIKIIGRIRLKDHYADDDVIPFDNIYLLTVAGQTVNSMYNTDLQAALARDTYVKGLIETEGNYKKINTGQPVEIFRPLSGGMAMGVRRAGFALRKFMWPGNRRG